MGLCNLLGGGGVMGEGKGKDTWGDTTRPKNLDDIKSIGVLLLPFVIIGGSERHKRKRLRFVFRSVISCNNVIKMHLLLKTSKGVYSIIST